MPELLFQRYLFPPPAGAVILAQPSQASTLPWNKVGVWGWVWMDGWKNPIKY